MESLKNLINLFNSENFFFMTTFLPVMLYKDFSETQRISIFYIIFWFFPVHQKYIDNSKNIPIIYIIGLFIIITFLSLEILTFDVPKLSLITNIFYKIADYIFIMLSQYGVIYIILSIVILEFKNNIIMIISIFFICKEIFELLGIKILFNLFNFEKKNATVKVYIWKLFCMYAIEFFLSFLASHFMIINSFFCSISLFTLGILVISFENFKIKTVTEFFKYIPPPVKTDENIFLFDCIYDINFFEWIDRSDKKYYDIIYQFLNKKKIKIFEYLGIDHMQIALIRSLGIWYGRENLIRSYFFILFMLYFI